VVEVGGVVVERLVGGGVVGGGVVGGGLVGGGVVGGGVVGGGVVAKLAVIVPGPLMVAVEETEDGWITAMDPVVVHDENV
jgi:hypothetical protein